MPNVSVGGIYSVVVYRGFQSFLALDSGLFRIYSLSWAKSLEGS